MTATKRPLLVRAEDGATPLERATHTLPEFEWDAVAPLIAPLLGWDEARVAAEIAAYADRHPLVRA